MRKMVLASLLFFASMAFAQNPGIVIVGTAPSGSCPQGAPGNLVNSTGKVWTCQNISNGVGTWTLETGGGGGGSPGGSDTQGQFNNNGSFAGSPGLIFGDSTKALVNINTGAPSTPNSAPITQAFAGVSGDSYGLIDFANQGTGMVSGISVNSQVFTSVNNDALVMGTNIPHGAGGGCLSSSWGCIWTQWNSSFVFAGSNTVEFQINHSNQGSYNGVPISLFNLNVNGTTGLDNFAQWDLQTGMTWFCLTAACPVGSVASSYAAIGPSIGISTGFSLPINASGQLEANNTAGAYGLFLNANSAHSTVPVLFVADSAPANCVSNTFQTIYTGSQSADPDLWYQCPITSTAAPTLWGSNMVPNLTSIYPNSVRTGTQPDYDLRGAGSQDGIEIYSAFTDEADNCGLLQSPLGAGSSIFYDVGICRGSVSSLTTIIMGGWSSVAASFRGGSTQGLHIDTSGNVGYGASAVAGVTAGSFSAITAIATTQGGVTTLTGTSDARLKTDIHPDEGSGLAAIMPLIAYVYGWNEEGQKITGFPADLRQLGFIAQNVQESIPEAIGHETHDGVDYLTIADRPILAKLVKAVQEQQAQIEQLKSEVNELKAKQ